MTKVIEKLNDLIRLDIDAISAYRAAIDACEVPMIRTKLTEFRRDHERHVRELSDEVVRMGGRPAKRPDIKGVFILGFTKLASRGDHSALMAMRGNEELTTRVYQSALRESLGKVRTLVERNFRDEQRHLGWIKMALETRAWHHEELEEPVHLAATGTEGRTQRSGRKAVSRSTSSTGRTPRRRPRARSARS